MKNLIFVISIVLVALSSCVTRNDKPIVPDDDGYIDLRGSTLNPKGVKLTKGNLIDIDLSVCWFDTETPWPEKKHMPKEFDPKKIIERGKDPGLNIRKLHKEGITGSGIKVAIIDQPIYEDHIEYKDNLQSVNTINPEYIDPSMHGSAVASLLCGKSCGVAPGVELHFWSAAAYNNDYADLIEALSQIIEYNKDKELSDKIRVVSASVGFSPDVENLDRWSKKIQEAEEEGIIVVHCSVNMLGARCNIKDDKNNPKNYEICFFQKNYCNIKYITESLFVPIDNRTFAGYTKPDSYAFCEVGGYSWGAPYIAGVVALGLQINPELNREQIETLLYSSGTPLHESRLINPEGFIEAVKNN